jgi:hypothetical protein
MRGLPDEGPVVIINIHNDRCDALALMAGADEPMHIPLSNFRIKKQSVLPRASMVIYFVRSYITDRHTIMTPAPSLPDVDLAEVLSVLWSQVVWPILESLAFSVRLFLSRFLQISLIITSSGT